MRIRPNRLASRDVADGTPADIVSRRIVCGRRAARLRHLALTAPLGESDASPTENTGAVS
jgi:hypothetical protein